MCYAHRAIVYLAGCLGVTGMDAWTLVRGARCRPVRARARDQQLARCPDLRGSGTPLFSRSIRDALFFATRLAFLLMRGSLLDGILCAQQL